MSTISIGSIPSAQVLEARFHFVKNQTLKTNLAIYLRYTILLLALSEQSELGSLHYSIYKDVVVYTASVVESALEYAVREYIVKGKVKQDVFGYTWHYTELANIKHDCVDFHGASFIVQKKEASYKTNARDLGFDDINKAAKIAKIIDERLFAKAEDLRKKRNLIHLSSLEKSSDDYIKKEDVTKCLEDAKAILLEIENKLNSL
jgi:hypothetical protein